MKENKKIVFDLDPYEQSIEDQIETFVPVSKETRARLSKIIERDKKSRNISLRFNNSDLEQVKQKAYDFGLPYQTFITMILHKYITGQFWEKNEVMKVLQAYRK